MKKYFLKISGVALLAALTLTTSAQQKKIKTSTATNEQIIIKKVGDKDTKVVVEIKDGEVTVNGKPLAEFKDENVIVIKGKTGVSGYGATAPRSIFRGGTAMGDANALLAFADSKGAFLGVTSEDDAKGAKIKSVSKTSAAEKAGLKEGDIITKVNDEKIDNPGDLSNAIGKFKPEEKVTIAYLREGKEQKTTASLGKRTGTFSFSPDMNFNFDHNFEGYAPMAPGQYGDMLWKTGKPKLGIKAQDTEDGKGVKVIAVDDESNAAKAGIKEGDIITEFDGKAINSADELVTQARETKDKNSIKVKLTRDGKSQDVEIKIPKKLKTANL